MWDDTNFVFGEVLGPRLPTLFLGADKINSASSGTGFNQTIPR